MGAKVFVNARTRSPVRHPNNWLRVPSTRALSPMPTHTVHCLSHCPEVPTGGNDDDQGGGGGDGDQGAAM